MITCDTDEVETQLVPSIPTVGTRLIGRYGKGSLDSTRLERFFVNSENVTEHARPLKRKVGYSDSVGGESEAPTGPLKHMRLDDVDLENASNGRISETQSE